VEVYNIMHKIVYAVHCADVLANKNRRIVTALTCELLSTVFVYYILSRKPRTFRWIHKLQHVRPQCPFTLCV